MVRLRTAAGALAAMATVAVLGITGVVSAAAAPDGGGGGGAFIRSEAVVRMIAQAAAPPHTCVAALELEVSELRAGTGARNRDMAKVGARGGGHEVEVVQRVAQMTHQC